VKSAGDPEAREKFRAAAFAALKDCTPIKMTDQFSRDIPGRVISVLFTQGANAGARSLR
jgi:hypothetical protein